MAKKKSAAGISKPLVRKRPEEPEIIEGLPEWMATFSDMVTLLLTFFVLLLTFANQDLVKFKIVAGSVKEAFGVQTEDAKASYAPYSPTRFERKEMPLDVKQKKLLDLVLGVKAVIEGDAARDKAVKVTTDQNGVLQRVDNAAMFAPGSTELSPRALPILDRVGKLLKERNVDVVISGHTDTQPAASADYPSNWELSSARAARALRYLTEKWGIDPGRMKAAGYAGSRPLVPNDTEDNRARNNRVELYFHARGAENW